MPLDQPPAIYTASGQMIAIPSLQPLNIVIHGPGTEPLVTISLKDGSMTFSKNYTPDAAAMAFWQAISGEYRTYLAWKAAHPDGAR